ncbi:MAG: cell division protein SepF [Peptococcaceae bacterium]|nr:cell division protein SepF [Peptococcaceae bacterium]MDH7524324.1 cell division protein SepF [Peptococcaceae bacterium]
MKVFDRFLDLVGFTEVKEEVVVEEESPLDEVPEWKPSRKTRGQVVPLNTSKEQIKVVLIEPAAFDDCQQIADSLKNKRTVIINLENIDLGLARRIIDFVGGTAYALGGALQKIGSGIIIAVPSNVDISGDIHSMSQPKEVFAWINKLTQGNDFNRRY